MKEILKLWKSLVKDLPSVSQQNHHIKLPFSQATKDESKQKNMVNISNADCSTKITELLLGTGPFDSVKHIFLIKTQSSFSFK